MDEEKEMFWQQEIWPFNKNVVSKTLISIIILEYYAISGVEEGIFGIIKNVFN